MTANAPAAPAPTDASITDAELARLGITRTTVAYFHVGDYRYTKLDDALAEAGRRQEAG